MEGLTWELAQLPLATGLQQKSDDRARSAPALDIANDVQFDELGGLQTRLPYNAIGADIFGGGTITNSRRIVEYDGELLLFTNTALYSWNAQLSKWVQKGTHLAVAVDEKPAFIDTGEQRESDRAELNGTIVYAWSEPSGSTYGSQVRVAAIDKVTGSVLMPPTTNVDAGGGQFPRLVALSTRILLLYQQVSGSNVKYKRIDPATPATAVSAPSSPVYLTNSTWGSYDVERIPGADAAIATVVSDLPAEGIVVMRIPASGSTTFRAIGRRNNGNTESLTRTAIAISADGSTAAVIRASSNRVEADLINPTTLADGSFTSIAVGPTSLTYGPAFVTAAFSSAASVNGPRCHVWWDEDLTEGRDAFLNRRNHFDAGNGVAGTSETFIYRLGLASRAFDHNGDVFVWLTFGGETDTAVGALSLQSSYYLYRSDKFLAAKAVNGRGGGLTRYTGSPRGGVLPGVQLVEGTTGYAWCGTERRVIDVGTDGYRNYADRGPRDVLFTFDSNRARRCARLGATLYITGGEILQYDGQQLTEVGFHLFPWSFDLTTPGAGNVEIGSYTYKSTLRWQNARGEIDRSTTATLPVVTISTSAKKIRAESAPPLPVTHKTTNPPALEYWRTAKDPTDDAPFFLATSKDPSSIANPNRYVANDYTDSEQDDFEDDLTDALLTVREQHDEFGPVVRLAPPPASIIVAGADRLFLAGIAGDPDQVWYSRLRSDGEVAAFHGALTIPIPRPGGDITALAFLNETLIVFRETAIYALAGDGFDNAGGGQNYGPARMLSEDVGAVNAESVAFMPSGLVFKSSKGWYALNRGWSLDYIGASVADYDGETPLAIHLVETQHQVRILTSLRMLVWDYLAQQWGEWTISGGLHACMWSGAHVYLDTVGPRIQETAYTALTYGLDVETAWFKPADLQGFSRVRKLQILGEYRSTDLTHLRIRIAYNYSAAYVDDRYWPVSPTTVGGPLQLKIGPRRQQVQAIKIRITAIRRYVDESLVTINGAPTGEAMKLTGLAVEVGLKRGPYPRLSAAQRS